MNGFQSQSRSPSDSYACSIDAVTALIAKTATLAALAMTAKTLHRIGIAAAFPQRLGQPIEPPSICCVLTAMMMYRPYATEQGEMQG